MISSEVQRTLVKSPPELWAELSDPAALARHLGELGEIRVTRVEPEQLVEWEAGNRTGTVHLKPSGWGTKVTLTVASDVPEPSTSAQPAPATAAEPMPTGDEPSAAPDEPSAAPDEPTAAPDEPTAALDEPTAAPDEPVPATGNRADPSAVDELSAHAGDEPAGYFESVPSPLGAPLTAAGASSWRVDEASGESDDASDGSAEDDAGFAADAEDHEESGEAYAWQPYENPEPRRGFFARLFGRWRSSAAFDGEIAGEPSETTSAADELPEPEPETPAAEGAPESHASPVDDVEAVAVAEREPEPGAAVQGEPALEADTAVELPSMDEPWGDESEPISEAPVEEAPAERAADGAAAEPEAAPPQTARAEQGEGIAAELKAAEETEDAEVTAVLTSVLDRLGAAHHRPFSRS